jgi:hypothetical protein
MNGRYTPQPQHPSPSAVDIPDSQLNKISVHQVSQTTSSTILRVCTQSFDPQIQLEFV